MRLPRWSAWLCSLAMVFALGQQPTQMLAPSEHNPLYLLFYVPTWQTLENQPVGQKTIGMAFHYTNIFEWRSNDRFIQDFDGEMGSLNLIGEWALTKRVGFSLDWGFHRFSGGFLDKGIQSFHDTFNLANDDRDLVMDNRSVMHLQTADGTTLFEAESHTWHADNPQLRFHWSLPSKGAWHSNLALSAKIPLGNGPFHNSHFDTALSYHGRYQATRWQFDLQTGLLTLTPPKALAPITRDFAAYGKLWVARSWRQNISTFAELNSTSPYFENTGLDTLDPESVNLILGMSAPIRENAIMTLTFGEDISAKGPALDFHVNAGVTFTW